ncbi:MAG: DUF2275 domain-containing protein, partial [Candidatus Binatia bacterium]
ADLPSVEPPLGFSQRVMTRIREEAERPRIWHRLFLPIRVKIPIHATALLLVGGFAVYLYQASQPSGTQLAKSLPVKPEAPFRQALEAEKKEKDVESTTSAASPLALTEQGAKFADEVSGALKRPEESAREERRSLEARRRQARADKESMVTQAHLSRAPSVRPADYEFVLAPGKILGGTRVLREKLDGLVKRVQGEYVQTKEEMKKKKRDLTLEPQIIGLNLSEDKFEQFKTELASLGRVESVSRLSSLEGRPGDKTRAQLRIKITILPPVE